MKWKVNGEDAILLANDDSTLATVIHQRERGTWVCELADGRRFVASQVFNLRGVMQSVQNYVLGVDPREKPYWKSIGNKHVLCTIDGWVRIEFIPFNENTGEYGYWLLEPCEFPPIRFPGKMSLDIIKQIAEIILKEIGDVGNVLD